MTDWTAAAALIGMSVVLVCTTVVCVLVAVLANMRADEIRAQRDTVAVRAATAMRHAEVLEAARKQDLSAYHRRVDRWRTAYTELREQALEAVRVFGWHAADLPMPPVDTQMDDLSDTIPTEDSA